MQKNIVVPLTGIKTIFFLLDNEFKSGTRSITPCLGKAELGKTGLMDTKKMYSVKNSVQIGSFSNT